MASNMSSEKHLSEEEIDEFVVKQADDDMVWEDPISVQVRIPTTMSLPPELAAHAAFFARLHNTPDAESWLQRIIQVRVDFEESAFVGLKRVMEKKTSYKT